MNRGLRFEIAGAEGPRRYFEALTRDRLAHAYLFTGPRGVGKKTFARRLAQSLLCRAEKETVLGYDGTCASCVLFADANTRHPDFLEHEGILKIGAADEGSAFADEDGLSARDIVRQMAMQSYSGGMRVLLLGDVEFATQHAANALLKFLEEPPSGVVLLLTTATPDRLLPTIRSRLVELRFGPLAESAIRSMLEREGVPADRAARAARASGGSMTTAREIAAGENGLRAEIVRWFAAVVRGVTPEESWVTRETLDEGLSVVKVLARDWIARSLAGDAVAPLAVDAERDLAGLPACDPRQAEALLATLDYAQRLAGTNVPPSMIGEMLRMQITAASGYQRARKATSS